MEGPLEGVEGGGRLREGNMALVGGDLGRWGIKEGGLRKGGEL